MRPRPQRRVAAPTGGMTLIEVLVTLAIVAMVALILSQALQQLARIERLLEAGQLRSVSDSVRGAWVRQALESLLPGTSADEQLRATERELQGLSSEVPMRPAPGLGRLHLRLVTDAAAPGAGPETRLEIVPTAGTDSESAPVTLLRWPGREGRFRFMDASGAWHDRWPALSTENIVAPAAGLGPGLPRTVLIETGGDSPRLIVAALPVSSVPRPTRRQAESM